MAKKMLITLEFHAEISEIRRQWWLFLRVREKSRKFRRLGFLVLFRVFRIRFESPGSMAVFPILMMELTN
jgi:hypothetical protein